MIYPILSLDEKKTKMLSRMRRLSCLFRSAQWIPSEIRFFSEGGPPYSLPTIRELVDHDLQAMAHIKDCQEAYQLHLQKVQRMHDDRRMREIRANKDRAAHDEFEMRKKTFPFFEGAWRVHKT